MSIEKIMHMQEELIKGYKKQIASLDKENASLRRMLDMQNEIIETQKQELEVFERFWKKVEKAHEKAGSDRNAADAAESGTTEK